MRFERISVGDYDGFATSTNVERHLALSLPKKNILRRLNRGNSTKLFIHHNIERYNGTWQRVFTKENR